MTWNYRVMEYEDGEVGLHEVYYKKDGNICTWSQVATIVGSDKKDLLETLEMMRGDVLKDREILKYKY